MSVNSNPTASQENREKKTSHLKTAQRPCEIWYLDFPIARVRR